MVRIQSVLPHPALQPFICFFVQRDAQLGSSEAIEPVVARLGVTIEFKFAGLYEIRTYANNFKVRPNRISVVGPQTFRRVRLTLRHINSLTVMFQPCGSHALLGIPTNSLADISTEGHALLGKAIARLYERLGNLTSFSQRADLLNQYFLQLLQNAKQVSPVHSALHHLTVNRYCSISDAAQQAGLSRRQLERKSLIYAGIQPKALARIARFHSALQLSQQSSLNWTQIAHVMEYHDHMHLIRDFRAFAGQAPSGAQREMAPYHLINFSASSSAASL